MYRFGAFGMVALALMLCAGPALGKQLRPKTNQDLERIIDAMTLEEKVGQLLLIGFSGKQVTPHIRRWVEKRKVGSVAIFARNIESTHQIARFTRGIQSLTRNNVPVFVSLDQEGGNVVRLKDGATVLPGNMALGATPVDRSFLRGRSSPGNRFKTIGIQYESRTGFGCEFESPKPGYWYSVLRGKT